MTGIPSSGAGFAAEDSVDEGACAKSGKARMVANRSFIVTKMFASSAESVGELGASAWCLSQEPAEFAAGRVEGALFFLWVAVV
jgi:hypothetical protein